MLYKMWPAPPFVFSKVVQVSSVSRSRMSKGRWRCCRAVEDEEGGGQDDRHLQWPIGMVVRGGRRQCVCYRALDVTKVTYPFHSGPTDFSMLGSGYRLEEAWDACAIRLPWHSYGWFK